MDSKQEAELIADVKQARDTALKIHTRLEERCPVHEKRITRLEKAYMGIVSFVSLAVLGALMKMVIIG